MFLKINNKTLIKIVKLGSQILTFLRKHYYIIPFLSLLNRIRAHKNYTIIKYLVRLLIYVNIILGVAIVLYNTSPVNPFPYYLDFLNPYFDALNNYIDSIKKLINDLININIEESIASNIKESNQIKGMIKDGIKEGVKEAMDELLTEFKEVEASNTELLKQFSLISSVIFFAYFIFYLPGSSISPEELIQYNWLNHSLIELKINLINLLFNPSNPGTPGGSPINPIMDLNVNIPKTMVDVASSPIIEVTTSPISPSISTITPNTPIPNIKTLSEFVDVQTQTTLNGIGVGKMQEMTILVQRNLPDGEASYIRDAVNSVITNITD